MPEPRQIVLTSENVKPVEGDDGKFTVTLPDSVVTEEEIKANFRSLTDYQKLETGVQDRLTGAVANAKAGAADELLKDDIFLTRAITERKEFFTEKFPGDQVDLDKARDQFRAEEVTPLQEKLDGAETKVGKLQESSRLGTIQTAMANTGVAEKERMLMEAFVNSRTRWDEELGRCVVRDEKGDTITKVVEGSQMAVTVEMFLADLKAGGKFDHAFNAEVKEGAGVIVGPVTPENIQERIDALEKEGKLQEAGVLKEQLHNAAKGRL